jgi:hypothetical protein
MNNNLETTVSKETVPEYVKKMLTVMPGGIFLPVSIAENSGGGSYGSAGSCTLISDATGFVPLFRAGQMLTAERVYTWLEKLLKALIGMSEYLINPEDLVLTGETVFVSPESAGDVRILFMPLERTENSSDNGGINGTLNSIIKEILIEIDRESISRDLHSYINATIGIIEKNCSASELYAHIIKLRREANLCGIV